MFLRPISASSLGLLSLQLSKLLATQASSESPNNPKQVVRFINAGDSVVDPHDSLVHLSPSFLAAQVALDRLGHLDQFGHGQGWPTDASATSAVRGSAILRELAKLKSEGARFEYTEAIVHAGHLCDALAAGRARFS